MRWPWSKPETRQSATDAVVAALVSRAGGGVASDPNSSGALEMACGVWSRCFAAATVTPAVPLVSPTFLAGVARDLARRGESVHLLDIADGRLVALPCGSWDIRGDVDAATWVYQLHRFGPTRSSSQYVGADSVLHFRYATDPARPWQGISPLGWARDLGAIAGGTDLRLGEEAGGAVSRLIPVPQDGGDGGDGDPLAGLKSDIKNGKGRALVVETTAAGWGEGKAAAPQSDWKQQRIGPDPPAEFCNLRDSAAQAVLAAHGINPALLMGKSDGTLMREAWRQLMHGALRPVARTIADELGAKLDMPAPEFDFTGLYASDLAGRAQAFQKLVAGTVPVADALAMTGLLAMDDGA